MTCSSTARRFARTAIQTSRRRSAEPAYSTCSGPTPRTFAIGPSTPRITSATVISSGRPREPVAAVDAALAADEAGVPQVAEDVLEELERDLLRLCDALALDRAVSRRCELDHRPQRVVHLRRDAHGVHCGERCGRDSRGAAAAVAVRLADDCDVERVVRQDARVCCASRTKIAARVIRGRAGPPSRRAPHGPADGLAALIRRVRRVAAGSDDRLAGHRAADS